MKYSIKFSVFAREDVREIKKHLAQFYLSTPEKFTSELKRCIAMLETTPKMFEVYECNQNYRKIVVYNYVVFYRIDEERKRVFIYRVLHGKQDREQHL